MASLDIIRPDVVTAPSIGRHDEPDEEHNACPGSQKWYIDARVA